MSANSAAPATTAVASATPNAVAATSPTIRAAIEIRDRRSTAPSRYLVRGREGRAKTRVGAMTGWWAMATWMLLRSMLVRAPISSVRCAAI